jgi:ABC-type bacteriocin/lantibiotic exporter with double-glycine peptidase domain
MLARTITRRPRILLLDEAAGALDNPAQDIVAANLETLGMTRLIIAHRLSIVRRADAIVALDARPIVERGTYGELID